MAEKLTQHKRLIKLFRINGGTLTHEQIRTTDLYREHSARMSDLRKKGYEFKFKKGRTAQENRWTMIEPVGPFKREAGGQLIWA